MVVAGSVFCALLRACVASGFAVPWGGCVDSRRRVCMLRRSAVWMGGRWLVAS
jgi:hypothetical protein